MIITHFFIVFHRLHSSFYKRKVVRNFSPICHLESQIISRHSEYPSVGFYGVTSQNAITVIFTVVRNFSPTIESQIMSRHNELQFNLLFLRCPVIWDIKTYSQVEHCNCSGGVLYLHLLGRMFHQITCLHIQELRQFPENLRPFFLSYIILSI
jgi:hypothetical protein